jgi:hypothetical protein
LVVITRLWGHCAGMVEHVHRNSCLGDDETVSKTSIVLILEHKMYIHGQPVAGGLKVARVKDNLDGTKARLCECPREFSRRVRKFIAGACQEKTWRYRHKRRADDVFGV